MLHPQQLAIFVVLVALLDGVVAVVVDIPAVIEVTVGLEGQALQVPLVLHQ